MMPELHMPLEDELCPVADQTLGEMYRASAHGLNALIATVSPAARALLAVYCYRRAHLVSIGLAIATTCEKDALTSVGGRAGAALFERSRDALPDARVNGRRKITLAAGLLREFGPLEEEGIRVERIASTAMRAYQMRRWFFWRARSRWEA